MVSNCSLASFISPSSHSLSELKVEISVARLGKLMGMLSSLLCLVGVDLSELEFFGFDELLTQFLGLIDGGVGLLGG